MTTVLRIKRHLNEDPLGAFLLNCKRRKTEDSTSESIADLSTIAKFTATVENPEDVFKHIKPSNKRETVDQYKKHSADIVKKLRQQNRKSSQNNRYKIINTFRSTDLLTENPTNDVNCTLVDVEATDDKENCDSNSKSSFVYDLYYTNSDDLEEADLNEFISVYPLSDGVIYGNEGNDKYNGDSDSNDSEDSNAENNWKNDYPDESDVESIKSDNSVSEETMLRAMNKVTLDDDLSSDDYDEACGYDRAIGDNDDGDDDDDDVKAYSKFKAQFMKQRNDGFCFYEECDDSCTP